MPSRSQMISLLVIGVAAMVVGILFAWGDVALNRTVRGAAGMTIAWGLIAAVGGAVALARSKRVDPKELEDRWKL